MIWDELTYIELENLNKDIPVILPIAATEQHGPHLPWLLTGLLENILQEHCTKPFQKKF